MEKKKENCHYTALSSTYYDDFSTLHKEYEYKKYKSQSKVQNQMVYEYLYLCEVGKEGEFSSKIIKHNDL